MTIKYRLKQIKKAVFDPCNQPSSPYQADSRLPARPAKSAAASVARRTFKPVLANGSLSAVATVPGCRLTQMLPLLRRASSIDAVLTAGSAPLWMPGNRTSHPKRCRQCCPLWPTQTPPHSARIWAAVVKNASSPTPGPGC